VKTTFPKALNALALVLAINTLSCRKDIEGKSSSRGNGGFTAPPGGKAGGADAAALSALYQKSTDKPPAAVRPDPDLYARRLLRQYRPEGTLVAREIGRVEEYRLLLGGASEDFRTVPQESYDATSLLAMQKVTEDICTSLVAPNAWQHPGWKTILPNAAGNVAGNLKFLAQRILGLPSARIPSEVLTDLTTLTNTAKVDGQIRWESYVPACVALSSDAEALLL
jgi:hypothetical protein